MTEERGAMSDDTRDQVADHYRAAAAEIAEGSRSRDDDGDTWGSSQYDDADVAGLPDGLVASSLGCGNPYALAELHEGETVLDLGSGAGLDVILSARRVGPAGRAYGVDFLEEMREQARENAVAAGVDNVEFLDGTLDAVPLSDGAVDVVISNCVLCLAEDKRPVFAEIVRVLRPGGRMAVTDVVADDDVAPDADPVAWAELGLGGLRVGEYVEALEAAGMVDVTVELTHETSPGFHSAAIRGRSRSNGAP